MKERLSMSFIKAIGGSFMLKGSFDEIIEKCKKTMTILGEI